MTNHPSREAWQADAERAVLQGCYPHQRISRVLADHADEDSRVGIAQGARHARTGLSRIVKLIEQGDPEAVTLDEIRRELDGVHILLRRWKRIEDATSQAAMDATVAAVRAEVARRQTDEAWEQELAHRAQIDATWPDTATAS